MESQVLLHHVVSVRVLLVCVHSHISEHRPRGNPLDRHSFRNQGKRSTQFYLRNQARALWLYAYFGWPSYLAPTSSGVSQDVSTYSYFEPDLGTKTPSAAKANIPGEDEKSDKICG